MSASTRFPSTLLFCTLALAVSGCQSWTVRATPVPELMASKPPREIRVTLRDGTRTVMARPTLAGDSLRARTRSVALADVTRVEVRRIDPVKSIVAVVILVPLVAGVACALTECFNFNLGPMWSGATARHP